MLFRIMFRALVINYISHLSIDYTYLLLKKMFARTFCNLLTAVQWTFPSLTSQSFFFLLSEIYCYIYLRHLEYMERR